MSVLLRDVLNKGEVCPLTGVSELAADRVAVQRFVRPQGDFGMIEGQASHDTRRELDNVRLRQRRTCWA